MTYLYLLKKMQLCCYFLMDGSEQKKKNNSDAVNDFFLLACNNSKEKSTQLTHKLTLSLPSHPATGIDSQSKNWPVSIATLRTHFFETKLGLGIGTHLCAPAAAPADRCVKREDDRAAFYSILRLNSFFCVW